MCPMALSLRPWRVCVGVVDSAVGVLVPKGGHFEAKVMPRAFLRVLEAKSHVWLLLV